MEIVLKTFGIWRGSQNRSFPTAFSPLSRDVWSDFKARRNTVHTPGRSVHRWSCTCGGVGLGAL